MLHLNMPNFITLLFSNALFLYCSSAIQFNELKSRSHRQGRIFWQSCKQASQTTNETSDLRVSVYSIGWRRKWAAEKPTSRPSDLQS